ncbi:hypothetical protein AMTRI_Chr13g123620 [Amborella trichopoda]
MVYFWNKITVFKPLRLRIGGTLQDKVMYEMRGMPCNPFVMNDSELFGCTQGCLTMKWAKVFFGLSALHGRVAIAYGSMGGPWNSRDTVGLLHYIVNQGYTAIQGWELASTRSPLREKRASYREKCVLFGSPYGNRRLPLRREVGFPQHQQCFLLERRELPRMRNATDVPPEMELSGSGIGARIGVAQYAADVRSLHTIVLDIYKGFNTKPLMIAPGGFFDMNWFSELVSRTEPHLGMYLDQLAMAANFDTKVYCRQSLMGGYYGLLNATTYLPNPDYYRIHFVVLIKINSLLWHKVMGAKEGIAVLLINLDGNTTVHFRMTRMQESNETTREEYHLTAKNGDLHTPTMLFNWRTLTLDPQGGLPSMEPIRVSSHGSITVAPYSIVFIHMAYIYAIACG